HPNARLFLSHRRIHLGLLHVQAAEFPAGPGPSCRCIVCARSTYLVAEDACVVVIGPPAGQPVDEPRVGVDRQPPRRGMSAPDDGVSVVAASGDAARMSSISSARYLTAAPAISAECRVTFTGRVASITPLAFSTSAAVPCTKSRNWSVFSASSY